MSTHNICFYGKIRKAITWILHLSRAMLCFVQYSLQICKVLYIGDY